MDSRVATVDLEGDRGIRASWRKDPGDLSMRIQYAFAAYYIIQPAEASSNLGRFDGLPLRLATLEERTCRRRPGAREARDSGRK